MDKTIYTGLSERRREAWKRTKKNGRNLPFNITTEYLYVLYEQQQGKCALSGLPLEFKSGTPSKKNPYGCSIDRIDSDVGYVEGNVRLLTHIVNNAKSTYTDSLLIEVAKKLTNHTPYEYL